MAELTETQRKIAEMMSERELDSNVRALAAVLGWRVYHPYRSTRSAPGWPDLALANPAQRRVLFRELKRQRGKPTADQRWWLAALDVAGTDVGVWRPADWLSGRIERELRPVKAELDVRN